MSIAFDVEAKQLLAALRAAKGISENRAQRERLA
jgi:hypothetical protein